MIPERIVGSVGEYLLIEKRTYLGYPYVVWVKPMPRVNDDLVRIVVYLYPSEQSALDGGEAGGTGFIVRFQTAVTWYDYAITNRHNVRPPYSATFVRVNTLNKRKPLEIFEGDWECSKTDDLAACELPLHRAHFHYQPLWMNSLVTEEDAKNLRIGLGDDLFMVGRFMHHAGIFKNTPVLRFGTIAMMSEEPIVIDGKRQDSFLIEIRTIPGFSGSPVFIHMPGDSRGKDPLFKPSVRDQRFIEQYGYLERCLGIEWCKIKGETYQINAGMSGCIPAWKIIDFLRDNDKFAMKRRETDRQVMEEDERRKNQEVAEYTAAKPEKAKRKNHDIDIPLINRKDFFANLKKATKRKS